MQPPVPFLPQIFGALLLLSFFAIAQPASASDSLSRAWETLPPYLRDGVVKVSADNATATSETWYFIAKNSHASNRLYSVTVTDGAITAEKPSLDLREVLTHPTPIAFSRIEAGSAAAWAAAEKFAAGIGRVLGTVSYILQQEGDAAAPVWSIWCYGPDGSYFGMLKILATDGSVISTQSN